MARFTDAEKLKYWRDKALTGGQNVQSGNTNYSSGKDKDLFKKSGAVFTQIPEYNKSGKKNAMGGLHAVNAWKKTSAGMIKASAFPIDNKSSESGTGNQYIPYLVSVTHMGTLQTTKYNAIMNIQSKVLVISDLSMCITPNGVGKTRGGVTVKGYFGRNYK